jgi:Carboxypeptidase regulatory-like domain
MGISLGSFAFSMCLLCASSSLAFAQQISDPNPAHAPSAEIDNKRPLISKKEKAPTTRTVSGKVVDEVSGTPLKGAIVTLTDLSTKEKRESITKEDGRYSFEDLSFTVDYQLSARYKNAVTDVRKLSQYDHSPKSVRILSIPDLDAASAKAGAEAKPSAEIMKDAPDPKKP